MHVSGLGGDTITHVSSSSTGTHPAGQEPRQRAVVILRRPYMPSGIPIVKSGLPTVPSGILIVARSASVSPGCGAPQIRRWCESSPQRRRRRPASDL
jgi:hypothetical protein